MYIYRLYSIHFVHKSLSLLFQFVVERHGNTLLPQYLGMYRLTVDGVQYYFVAMRNVFSSHLSIHKKFDLKGSTVDREASDKELDKNLPTFKDNDFINQGVRLLVGESSKQRLMDTLNADVTVSVFTTVFFCIELLTVALALTTQQENIVKLLANNI